VHLVDGTQEDVAAAWRTVRTELEAYGEDLGDKPELLALNKIDALDDDTRAAKQAELAQASGAEVRLVSGVSGEGVRELLRDAWRLVRARRGEIVLDDDDDDVRPSDQEWAP
jgi:GTPase